MAGVWRWLKGAGSKFSEIDGTTWAASFAYYAFFALLPLLLLSVSIATDIFARLQGEQKARELAFEYIVKSIPLETDGRQMMASTLEGVMRARGKLGVVALAGLFWSSLGFFQALVSAVNQAWDREPLSWWKLPVQNLKMVGILASALLLGNVLPTVLQTLQGYQSFGALWISTCVSIVGALAPSVVLFYGFLLFYKLAPRSQAQVTFSVVWLPALFVTTLLQLSQRLLTLYTTNFTNFNVVYGAFGGVIALLLWIYLAGIIIVFGGCLCAARGTVPISKR